MGMLIKVSVLILSMTISCLASGIDPRAMTGCRMNAYRQANKYMAAGTAVKIVVGEYKGNGHVWCEYYDEGLEKWLLAKDTAQPYFGYPIECYPEYKTQLRLNPNLEVFK